MKNVLFFLLALSQLYNYGKTYDDNDLHDNNNLRKIYQEVSDDTNIYVSDIACDKCTNNEGDDNRSYNKKKRQCRRCSCWKDTKCSCCNDKKTATGMIVGTAAGAGIGYAANGATGALVGGPIGFVAGALFSQIV